MQAELLETTDRRWIGTLTPVRNRWPASAGVFAWSPWQSASEFVPGPIISEADGPPLPPSVEHVGRPRHRWRRVLLTGLLLFLAVGLGTGGYLWERTTSTLHQMHSVSTPPPVVSGAVLGGKPNIHISTTGARAVENGPTLPPAQHPLPAAVATPPSQRNTAVSSPVAAAPVATLTHTPPVAAASPAPAVATTAEPATAGTNILILGVNAPPGHAIDVGIRSDAVWVLHLDPASGTCRILAVPDESRAMLPGYGLTKVNFALALGGIPFQQRVVEQMLGIRLDHYALIDFTGFQEFVDALHGVTIDLPQATTIEGRHYPAGQHTLNGQEALAYVRDAGSPDGTVDRIARQQALIRAIVDKAIAGGVFSRLPALLPAFAAHVRTDLSALDMIQLGHEYESICRGSQIQLASLEGRNERLRDPVLNQDLWFVVVDPAEIHRKVATLVGP